MEKFYDYKQNSPILKNSDVCEKIRKRIEQTYRQGKEYKENLEYNKNDQAIKNLLRFKITNNKLEFMDYEELQEVYNGFYFDCDSEQEVKDILINILKRKIDDSDMRITKVPNSRQIKIKMKNNRNVITLETDTMNSFVTTFNQFLREFCKQKYRRSWFDLYTKGYEQEGLIGGFIPGDVSKYSWLLENYDKIILKADEKEKIIFEKFNKFAHLTHTIGNFGFVPKSYNKARYAITSDYWDLTLVDLQGKALNNEFYLPVYKWYEENIDALLLDDYFENYDKNMKFSDLKIKTLFKNHKFDTSHRVIINKKEHLEPLEPKEYSKKLELFEEFLDNVNLFIENRNKMISQLDV